MTDDYTPTTEEVRMAAGDFFCGDPDDARHKTDICPGDAAFDRWLSAHDAEVRASVLAEQGEPEFEYGYELVESDTRDVLTRGWPFGTAEVAGVEGLRRAAEENDPEYPSLLAQVVKRTRAGAWLSAGPWLPVEENTEALTDGSEA